MIVSHSAVGSSSQDAVTFSYQNADLSSLIGMLKSIPDPRSRRGRSHDLVFLLAVSVVAVLAGAKGYRQIARNAADLPQPLLGKLGAKWDWFRCRYSWPSRSAIRNLLVSIDVAALDQITGAWLSGQACREGKNQLGISVDGKVMRGAWTDENGKVTLLSAMLHDEAVTIAQVRVPDGTSEITQAGTLLEAIPVPDGESVLITMDAAHTQQKTAKIIMDKPGFDYLMTVKGNTPGLQEKVIEIVRPLLREPAHDVIGERCRGRIKKWSCWITDAVGISFPGASQVACIRRDIRDITGTHLSKEFAFFITSGLAGQVTASDVNSGVRKHWGIENKSHYIRDTVWQEDANQSYTGNGPHALATLRNLAAGLFRLHGRNRIKETTEWVCRDRNRALLFMAT